MITGVYYKFIPDGKNMINNRVKLFKRFAGKKMNKRARTNDLYLYERNNIELCLIEKSTISDPNLHYVIVTLNYV